MRVLQTMAFCLTFFALGSVAANKTKPNTCEKIITTLQDSEFFVIDMHGSTIARVNRKEEAKAIVEEVYGSYGTTPIVIRGYEIVLEVE